MTGSPRDEATSPLARDNLMPIFGTRPHEIGWHALPGRGRARYHALAGRATQRLPDPTGGDFRSKRTHFGPRPTIAQTNPRDLGRLCKECRRRFSTCDQPRAPLTPIRRSTERTHGALGWLRRFASPSQRTELTHDGAGMDRMDGSPLAKQTHFGTGSGFHGTNPRRHGKAGMPLRGLRPARNEAGSCPRIGVFLRRNPRRQRGAYPDRSRKALARARVTTRKNRSGT